MAVKHPINRIQVTVSPSTTSKYRGSPYIDVESKASDHIGSINQVITTKKAIELAHGPDQLNVFFLQLLPDSKKAWGNPISVWYNNATNQDCKALQRVVRLAERISGSALPSLQAIYIKRCKSRAAKILKDSTHPGNHLFCLLPSGRRFRSMMAKTERLRKSFFPQAIRLLNSNSAS